MEYPTSANAVLKEVTDQLKRLPPLVTGQEVSFVVVQEILSWLMDGSMDRWIAGRSFEGTAVSFQVFPLGY